MAPTGQGAREVFPHNSNYQKMGIVPDNLAGKMDLDGGVKKAPDADGSVKKSVSDDGLPVKKQGSSGSRKPKGKNGKAYEKGKKVTARMVEDARIARDKAMMAAKDLPPSSKQTIASDGILAVSGFAENRISMKFRKKYSVKDVSFDVIKEGSEGYQYKKFGSRDNGIEGSHKGCHAEKQVISETKGDPIGVSKPMCECCKKWAQNRAEKTGKPVVIAEPGKSGKPGGTRIYEKGKDPVYIPDSKKTSRLQL